MKQQELGARGKPWLTEEFCPGVEYDGAGNLYLAVSSPGILNMLPPDEWPKGYTVAWTRYPEDLDVLVQQVSTVIFHPHNDGAPDIAALRTSYHELRKQLWRGSGLNRMELASLENRILALAGHQAFVEKMNAFRQTVVEVKSAIAFDSKHEIVRVSATSRRQKVFLRQRWRENIEKLKKLPPLAIFSWTVWVGERLKGIIGPRPTAVRPVRVSKTLKDITREFTRQAAKRYIDQLIVAVQINCLSPEKLSAFVTSEVGFIDRRLQQAGVEFPPFHYHHLGLVGRLKAFQNSF